jgi:hypothetical protein
MKMKKIIILLSTILFTGGEKITEEKLQYLVPSGSVSVFGYDLNLDSQVDLVVGSNHFPLTGWGGAVFLMNEGGGQFISIDSIYFSPSFNKVIGDFVDNNEYIDIFSITGGEVPNTIYVSVIFNYGLYQFDSIKSFALYPFPQIPYITSGDVTGNGVADILFAHNNHQLWGIIYNDGTGNFSAPETFSLGFFPNDIACGDVTGNGKADVVLAGANTIIVFSTETGFQQEVLGYTPSFSGGYTLLITDFDNDGDKDILVSVKYYNNHNRIYIFENLGDGQFFQHDYFEFTPFCSYAVAADFNNDSLPDLAFIASDHSGIHIYKNKGEFLPVFQQFIPKADLTLRGLYCEDFDNNGFIDLAFTSGWGQIDYYLHVLFNDGNGNFLEDPIISYQTLNFEPRTSNLTCYPNPFTTSVNIEFTLTEQIPVELTVFDLNGNHITTLIHKIMPPGGHTITWSSTEIKRKEVKNGMYLLRLKAGSQVQTARVIYLN